MQLDAIRQLAFAIATSVFLAAASHAGEPFTPEDLARLREVGFDDVGKLADGIENLLVWLGAQLLDRLDQPQVRHRLRQRRPCPPGGLGGCPNRTA